jgi:hypothetical protein
VGRRIFALQQILQTAAANGQWHFGWLVCIGAAEWNKASGPRRSRASEKSLAKITWQDHVGRRHA